MDKSERLHSLDAVRAFVLLLGIVLHATMSFVPGIGIPAKDSSPSTALSVTFYIIHIFRMSAFFMIAGFFAHLMFHRKGMRGFITDRRRRIALPLVAGWAVFFPLTVVAVAWGVNTTHGGTMPQMPDRPFLYWPLSHLWFLYVLLWMYGLTLAGRWAVDALGGTALRGRVDAAVRHLVRNHWAPLILAAPLCAYLYFMRPWPMWFGIPTPEHSLLPNMSALVGFGTAFVFGWLLHRQSELIRNWEARWPLHLALAIGLTLACLSIVGAHPGQAELELGWARLAYATCYTLAIWYWTFAIVGAALRFASGESPVRRYLADASYWMYLAHLPLVFFLQSAVARWDVHWGVKFPLILAIAMGLLLLSYRYWVRPTSIGETLNGRRYPRLSQEAFAPVAMAGSGGAALALQPVFPAMALQGDVVTSAVVRSNASSGGGSALASLQAVHKRFGSIRALDGIDLEVRPGELLAVLGPNGAGKTTAISLLLGLQQPDSGTVTLFGLPPESLDARRRIGVMMQEVALASELRVREHLDLVASYYPAPRSIAEVVAMTHIEALAERPYGKLSGGQKRQVQFAIALCGRPQLLFLDEPTVGLDVQARAVMWETIRGLVRQGCSVVLTTHYLEEAEALADRVIVVAKGKVIAAGSVAQMRSLVTRKRVSCVTSTTDDEVRSWPGIESVARENDRLHIVSTNAEDVVRRLLMADAGLRELEVRRAGLSEAFTELTQEPAS